MEQIYRGKDQCRLVFEKYPELCNDAFEKKIKEERDCHDYLPARTFPAQELPDLVQIVPFECKSPEHDEL